MIADGLICPGRLHLVADSLRKTSNSRSFIELHFKLIFFSLNPRNRPRYGVVSLLGFKFLQTVIPSVLPFLIARHV